MKKMGDTLWREISMVLPLNWQVLNPPLVDKRRTHNGRNSGRKKKKTSFTTHPPLR